MYTKFGFNRIETATCSDYIHTHIHVHTGLVRKAQVTTGRKKNHKNSKNLMVLMRNMAKKWVPVDPGHGESEGLLAQIFWPNQFSALRAFRP